MRNAKSKVAKTSPHPIAQSSCRQPYGAPPQIVSASGSQTAERRKSRGKSAHIGRLAGTEIPGMVLLELPQRPELRHAGLGRLDRRQRVALVVDALHDEVAVAAERVAVFLRGH